MSDVFPTPESPNIITFNKTFFLNAIFHQIRNAEQIKIDLKRNIFPQYEIRSNIRRLVSVLTCHVSFESSDPPYIIHSNVP